MRALRTMLAVTSLLAAGGCVDVYGPWGTSGTYHVLAANGQGIPAVLLTRVGEDGYTVRLTGGELRLRGDESFRLDLDIVESDRVSDTFYTQGLSGVWDRYGDVIRLEYTDPETGAWLSVAAYRGDGQLEVTLPGLVYGINVRLVLER